MKTINLRWMYPHYRHDEFVDVTDEVWEAMRQAQREMTNYERRKINHRAWYSLDAYSWMENYALDGLTLAEIGAMCGCSKVSVYESILAVRKKFLNFFANHPND